jgi:protein involved in polysaccharide export with SLBB domain
MVERKNCTQWRLLLVLPFLCGCAAFTNPVANGVPARLVPDELLADSKAAEVQVPLTWLRRKPKEVYRLAAGDVLGVYIEGVLGDTDELPPIHFPDVSDLPPSVGFPIPVRENGTVPLPLVEPVKVDGLSMDEAQQAILKAYTVDKDIIKADEARVLVTLIRARRAKILVVREDSPTATANVDVGFGLFSRSAPISPRRGQGTGTIVELPVSEADLLSVLAQTGGLPGPDAVNEIIIQRGYGEPGNWPNTDHLRDCARGDCADSEDDGGNGSQIIRIPLRLPPGSDPPFRDEDIILHSGDIVFIGARDAEVYYTAGLLPAREIALPRDQDLGVVEAVLRIGGPFINGGINSNNLNGAIVGSGVGNPSPSQLTVLRRTPDGRQVNIRVDLHQAARDPRENILVKAGDVLILQENTDEAFARYVSQVFDFSIIARIINRGSASGTASVVLP